MSRIPRPLARRIDRLARGAHAFHRWAHHPLCERYAGEVLRAGRRARVCRGCALAGAGAAVGVVVGLAAPLPTIVPVLTVAGMAAWHATSSFGFDGPSAAEPSRPRPWPPDGGQGSTPSSTSRRRPKLLTRFTPAALASATVALGLRSATAAGALAAVLALAAAALAVARYRRRGPDRSACLACPEQALQATCSGLRPIARREAAFRRAAARLLRA